MLFRSDKPESIPRLKAKLIEASRIYSKDKETVEWLVMQDVHDPRAFTIVERFENEAVCRPPYPYSPLISSRLVSHGGQETHLPLHLLI